MSVRLGTSGDRRFGHQVGRPHSVLCFSPHYACTAVCFQKLCLDRERYTVFWPYTICRPNTKTKRLAEHPHTHKLSVFFFLHVAIRNSLRSNNKSMPASTSRIKSPFCINTNQLFLFYHSVAPTTHICVYFSAATPATASTTAVAFHQHN